MSEPLVHWGGVNIFRDPRTLEWHIELPHQVVAARATVAIERQLTESLKELDRGVRVEMEVAGPQQPGHPPAWGVLDIHSNAVVDRVPPNDLRLRVDSIVASAVSETEVAEAQERDQAIQYSEKLRGVGS
jgi:hypothetical protein